MMTLIQFSEIFSTLAVQLRYTDADEATIDAYYAALKGIEPEFIAMAATQMAQDGGALVEKPGDSPHWFPKTSEWSARARKIENDRTVALYARLRKLPTPLCKACDDTGWARVNNRVTRCTCGNLRRLEVLGRRPMPALPAADERPAPDAGQFDKVRAMVKPLINRTGGSS